MSTYPRRPGMTHLLWRFYFHAPHVSPWSTFTLGLVLGVALTLILTTH